MVSVRFSDYPYFVSIKNAIVNIIGCQIFFKLSRMFKNIQIIKKIIVNFEKIDKNVKVASGDPP